MFVVVIGNPFDGMRLVGGFRTWDEAEDWAGEFLGPEEWNIVAVDSPDEVAAEGE